MEPTARNVVLHACCHGVKTVVLGMMNMRGTCHPNQIKPPTTKPIHGLIR